ncbi:MAG TPA: tol-pal system protein YbgF [Vicinamibacteria bacterium]|nr:tol-pal system protein YbgF [Vicinamibacteria bacterium]
MRRYAALAVILVAAPPAGAANKDIERLQFQISSLAAQLTDLQRLVQDNVAEIRRLNESLAEQGSIVKRGAQDRRTQDESVQVALKDITDRLGEIQERLQASVLVPQAPAASSPSQLPPGETPTAPGPGSPAYPAPPAGPAPAPRELYSQAYADYARGNYDLAISGFEEYLRTYPSTEFSDNAQYWIGECLYGKQKYAEAIEAWNTLFRDFPSSDKLPDARFKKGLALERLGRRSQALVEYRYVVDRYPNSEAGRKAREKLNAQ